MTTLGDALAATFALDAVETSFVLAAESIRLTENSHVDLRGDVSHARSELILAVSGQDEPKVIRSETVVRGGITYFQVAADQTGWLPIYQPRPAIGSLAALTVLYGADLSMPITLFHAPLNAALDLPAAREHVPDVYAPSLEDLLVLTKSPGETESTLPDQCTVRITVNENPLYISELVYHEEDGDVPLTFAVEVHSVPRMDLPVIPAQMTPSGHAGQAEANS